MEKAALCCALYNALNLCDFVQGKALDKVQMRSQPLIRWECCERLTQCQIVNLNSSNSRFRHFGRCSKARSIFYRDAHMVGTAPMEYAEHITCLLYTSDAADE